jgi:hypothetical protein
VKGENNMDKTIATVKIREKAFFKMNNDLTVMAYKQEFGSMAEAVMFEVCRKYMAGVFGTDNNKIVIEIVK